MAKDWIKMRSDLHTHPKVVRISSGLNADRLRTVGGLHAVWSIFDAHSTDGRLDGYTAQVIDQIIGWPGFCDQLIAVDWLSQDSQGVVMPSFGEHNGKSAKVRAEECQRKRIARESAKRPESVRDLSEKKQDKNGTREDKRREDIKNPLTPTGESPDGEESQKLCSKLKPAIDYQAVADAYNEILGARLPQVTSLNDKRKRQIKALQPQLNDPTLAGWRTYFEAFNEEAKPFYFGDNNRGWQASFDYLLRSDTLIKVREGSL